MINRKGDQETGTSTIILLLFLVVFAILAITYYSGTGQKVTELVNAKVLSKAGGLESIPLPSFMKTKLAARELQAVITLTPASPFCPQEEAELSAFDTILPKNVTISDIVCEWDFDATTDTDCSEYSIKNCGNNIPNDDVDSGNCFVRTSRLAAKSSATAQLTVMITGDVPGSGAYNTVTKIVNTTLLCEKPALVETIIQNNAATNIVLKSQTESGGLPMKTKLGGMHIKVDSMGETITLLQLDAGADGLSDYVLKGNFTGQFMIEDQNLALRINQILATCTTTDCSIPIVWYADKPLKIMDVQIPYTPTLTF